MKIHYYQVSASQHAPDITTLFSAIDALPLDQRLRTVNERQVRVESVENRAGRWYLDFTMFRPNGPGRVHPNQPIRGFTFNPGEQFGEEKAILYVEHTKRISEKISAHLGVNMSLFFERAYPYLIAALAFIAWVLYWPAIPNGQDNMLSASITVGAILTGFVATSKSILTSLKETPVMKSLESSGHLKDLVSYLAQAIYSSFFWSVLSLGGYFMSELTYYWPLWAAFGALAAASFVRVVRIQIRILSC